MFDFFSMSMYLFTIINTLGLPSLHIHPVSAHAHNCIGPILGGNESLRQVVMYVAWLGFAVPSNIMFVARLLLAH